MSRKILLPDGLPRRVVISDEYDPFTGVHVNPRTIFLDDNEPHPTTIEEIEDLLSKDSEKHDIVGEKVLDAALDIAVDADPLDHIKATLDALDADPSAEAVAWKAHRTESK